MAIQRINIGSSPNRGDGDPIRTAFTKINDNFNELYTLTGGTAAELEEISQDYAASMFNHANHQNIIATYDDANNQVILTVDQIDPGDLVGSVFADDSTLLVDAVNSSINLDGTVKGDIIPDTDVAYDLGSATNRFRDLYLSGSTIDLGGTTLSIVGGNLQVGGTDIKDVVTAAGVDYSEIQNAPTAVSELTNDAGYITLAEVTGEITVNPTGDLQGSVFADDSTLLVDGVNGKIVGPIEVGSVSADIYAARTFGSFINVGVNASSVNFTTDIDMLTYDITNATNINANTFTASTGVYTSNINADGTSGADVTITGAQNLSGKGGNVFITAGAGSTEGGNILIGTNADQTIINGTTLLIGSTEDTSDISIGQHNINNTTTTSIYGDTIFRNSRSIEFVGSDITFSNGSDPVKSPTVDFTNATVTGLPLNDLTDSPFNFFVGDPGIVDSELSITTDIVDFGTSTAIDVQNCTVLFGGASISNFAPSNIAFTPAIGPIATVQLDVVDKLYETVIGVGATGGGDIFEGTFTNTPTTDWKLWDDKNEPNSAYSISNVVDNGGGSYTITVPGYTFQPITGYKWFNPAVDDVDNKRTVSVDELSRLTGVDQILSLRQIIGQDGENLVLSTKSSNGVVTSTNMIMSSTNGVRTTINGTVAFDDAVEFNGATITGVDWNPIVASQIQANGLPSNTRFSQAAPVSSIGIDGDLQGAVTFDSNYIYYCTADYDGVTNIWKRVAWSGDTW